MSNLLTKGFAVRATTLDDPSECFGAVLQVLNVKRISAGSESAIDRFRAIVSDGDHFCQAMLATQLNHFVEEKLVDKHTLIKVNNFSVNNVANRKLLIILDMEVVPGGGDEKIGSPVSIEGPSKSAPAAQAAAPPPPAASRAANNSRPAAGRSVYGKGSKPEASALYPIEGLSPYQNKQARVIQKSDIKHWSNQRGDGKLFSVTFMDETGEIRATGFNDAVDNFYDKLEVGKVFFVSKARINIAKKQFSNVNNEYEIMFERDTSIEPCEDDTVPQVKYNFKGIGELGELQKDDLCDVIGVVKDVGDLGSITSKSTNKPFAKRDIQLVDQSGQSVRLTLWGKQAESFQGDDQPVIAFKGLKVGDFGGRSLSMMSNATMVISPDIPEAHSLRGWFDAEGQSTSFTAYTNSGISDGAGASASVKPTELKTIAQSKEEQLGMSEKTDFFSTQATIAFIKQEPFSYPACANKEGCAKKVVEDGGSWRCEKCDRNYDAPIHRYILNINVMDHTGSFWITAFNETAEQLMGISANDLMALKDDEDEGEGKFVSYFVRAVGRTYNLQMMAKQDTFQASRHINTCGAMLTKLDRTKRECDTSAERWLFPTMSASLPI
ncbi:hypothetical protein I350_02308 [Cryptococcus amylolentus CBS 6273]|uniref:Replication protein A subunit n=1 Tax=Cryptococcus amylolentus CBS 6273 TaxID=1296118 RepID=A0A1E3KCR2_9TREE|nr:hypothetical protein I350_02308 [Cryptococcus amylolentus CBS 6273]